MTNVLCKNTWVHRALSYGVLSGAIAVIPVSSSVWAEKQGPVTPQSLNSLENMPLAELLQVHVTVASREPETLAEAAGTVTSFSKLDIERLGVNTISELASLTPGYSTYHNIGENTLETRGQKASGFDNNRHLLLLDGIPINHIRAYTAPVDHNMPLAFAQQVDFLRGPASALYGVGAFYGVISVTPALKVQDSNGAASSEPNTAVSLQASDGARSLKLNQFINSSTAQGLISVSHYSQQASLTTVANRPSHLNYDDQTSDFAYTKWQWDEGPLKGVTAGGLVSIKRGGLGNFWADYSSEKNSITWDNRVAYVKYQKALSSRVQSHSFAKYGYSAEAATYYDESETLRSRYDYPFHNYQAQTELRWQLGEAQSIISGVNVDVRYGEAQQVEVAGALRTTPRSPTVSTQSYYVQYKNTFDVLKGSLLTLGARLDRGEAEQEEYRQLSPRLALVQKINSWLSIKAMYSGALRGPSVKELGVNNEVRIEHSELSLSDLEPETIRSIELAPYIETDRWRAGVTFYSNSTSDYLARNWEQYGEYVNIAENTSSKGVEVEVHYSVTAHSKVFVNTVSAHSDNSDGSIFLDIPNRKLNFGWLWSRWGELPLSGSLTYTALSGFETLHNHAEGEHPDNGKGYVNAHFSYPLHTYAQLGLKVDNLFNETAYWHFLGNNNVQMPQRSLRLDLTLSF